VASAKNHKRIVSLAFALTLLVCAIAAAARQEKTAEKPAAANTAKSSPEMERLGFYLGEWDYTETYPKSAFFSNGGKNSGVYTSKLGPGGNSLINSFHSQGPVGDFEGLLVMTGDPKEKAYKAYAFGNDFPGVLVETGQFEGAALVFRSEFSAGGAVLNLRNVTRLVAPGRIQSEEYMAVKDAPETLLVRVEAKKRSSEIGRGQWLRAAPLSLNESNRSCASEKSLTMNSGCAFLGIQSDSPAPKVAASRPGTPTIFTGAAATLTSSPGNEWGASIISPRWTLKESTRTSSVSMSGRMIMPLRGAARLRSHGPASPGTIFSHELRGSPCACSSSMVTLLKGASDSLRAMWAKPPRE
jgi:hypothetical protein